MKTAVDTSVLLAIAKGDALADAAIDALSAAHTTGQVLCCDVVIAELGAFFTTPDQLLLFLDQLSVVPDPTSFGASYQAGRLFAQYRASGGLRQSLIPDFLIGAHALVDCDALIALDRGYLKLMFKELKVIVPTV